MDWTLIYSTVTCPDLFIHHPRVCQFVHIPGKFFLTSSTIPITDVKLMDWPLRASNRPAALMEQVGWYCLSIWYPATVFSCFSQTITVCGLYDNTTGKMASASSVIEQRVSSVGLHPCLHPCLQPTNTMFLLQRRLTGFDLKGSGRCSEVWVQKQV